MAGEKDRVERFLGGGGQDLVEAQERLMSRVTLSGLASEVGWRSVLLRSDTQEREQIWGRW